MIYRREDYMEEKDTMIDEDDVKTPEDDMEIITKDE
jgi:hypothetical protein